jgi:hypothetical protein
VCNNGHNIPHRTVKNASLNVTTNLSAWVGSHSEET